VDGIRQIGWNPSHVRPLQKKKKKKKTLLSGVASAPTYGTSEKYFNNKNFSVVLYMARQKSFLIIKTFLSCHMRHARKLYIFNNN
jgi:hypothetical protein